MTAPPEASPSGSLWRHPDFLKLWAGQTISEMGSRITRDGLPLLAVMTLGASPWQMGVLNALSSAPAAVLGLFAGVWVDRAPRRPLLIAADAGRAVLLGTIPLAYALGRLRLELVYGIAGLVGVLTVLFSVAYRAYLPGLVGRGQLVEGNSKLSLSDSIAELVGPELAGVLIQALTAPVAILVDALSFAASVFTLGLIRAPEQRPAPAASTRPVLAELREGIPAVARHPALCTLAVAEGLLVFFGSFIGVLYGLFAIRELRLSPLLLGLTIGAGGASSLVGALLAGPLLRRFRLGPALVSLLLLRGLANLLIPLAGGEVWRAAGVLILAQLLGDGVMTVYFIHTLGLRQAVTPNHLLGRVNAGSEVLAAAVAPLGALAGGWLATAAGVRPTLLVAAGGAALAAAWLAISPIRRLAAMPAPVED